MELTGIIAESWESDSPIADVLRATLEDLIFEDPFPVREESIEVENSIFIKVDILDPPIGGAVLALKIEVARELFKAMSGALSNETPEDDAVIDAIGELTNIFTGKLLRQFFQVGQQFKLSLPEKVEAEFALHVDQCVRFSVGLSMGTLDAFIFGQVVIDYLSAVKKSGTQTTAVCGHFVEPNTIG